MEEEDLAMPQPPRESPAVEPEVVENQKIQHQGKRPQEQQEPVYRENQHAEQQPKSGENNFPEPALKENHAIKQEPLPSENQRSEQPEPVSAENQGGEQKPRSQQEPLGQENHLAKQEPGRKENHGDKQKPSALENHGREQHDALRQPEAKENQPLEQPEPVDEENQDKQQEPEGEGNQTGKQEPVDEENQDEKPELLENQHLEQAPALSENHPIEQPSTIETQSEGQQKPSSREDHRNERPSIDFYQMNLLCRSYLDIQQSRIALGHRNRLLFWEAAYYLTYEPGVRGNQSGKQPENKAIEPRSEENQGNQREPLRAENQRTKHEPNFLENQGNEPQREENQNLEPEPKDVPNFCKATFPSEPRKTALIAQGWGVDSEDVVKAIESYDKLLKPQKDRKTGREIPPRFKFEQSKLEYWKGHGFKKPEVSELLDKYERSLLKNEKGEMLRDAERMFAESGLWAWCGRTRGLGPVAALTFIGYINPEKCITAGKFWAYCGYVPGAKMKSGERGNYNPELKGRFYVITRNVVMAQDLYYVALLNAKKQYYLTMRPDILEWEENKVKGWKGHVNNMALRWLTKLLQSHAIQILREENGLPFPKHHTFIPPKSPDQSENDETIKRVVPFLLRGDRD